MGKRWRIGANTAIDRGGDPDAVIGAGRRIDNLVQIGHNVRIGKSCVIVAQAAIFGDNRIGDNVVIGGQGRIGGQVDVGTGARIGAKSGVISKFPAAPGMAGTPRRRSGIGGGR